MQPDLSSSRIFGRRNVGSTLKYQGFLVGRYLRSRVIPIFAVLAVAFGVFVLISVLAVMEGFKFEMRTHIRGTLSHLIVSAESGRLTGEDQLIEKIQSLDHVVAAAPFVEGLGIWRTHGLSTCTFRGIDPVAESKVSEFAHHLLRDDEIAPLVNDRNSTLPVDRAPLSEEEIREAFSLAKRKQVFATSPDRMSGGDTATGFESELPPQPIVVGLELLRRRRVLIGDIITLSSFSPYKIEPRSQRFLVVGAFRTGVHEQDSQWMYMPLRSAQAFLDLFNPNYNDFSFNGLGVKLDDYAYAQEVKEKIATLEAGPYYSLRANTWEEMRKTLLAAVDVEKKIIFAMMLLIIAFAGAMIFLILALMAIEKTRDIGVLQSLGATPRGLVLIFMRLGMTLTVSGILIGVGTGWLLTENINRIENLIHEVTGYELFPAHIYFFTEIPIQRTTSDLVLIAGAALGFGFLGSVVPALWAARKDPVKTLRYE